MNRIRISDMTMKQDVSLSFKEKIELAKLLDKLDVSVIELEGIRNPKIDALRIKSIASAVSSSILAVPVQLSEQSVAETWNALRGAKHPRLQVCAPVSSVQMEYLYHKKPEAMLSAVCAAVAACKARCADVEFIADDATRSDPAFLAQILAAAMESGADVITLCDTAGTMMPEEFAAFIKGLYEAVPALNQVCLGVSCSNSLSMADACVIAAVCQGAGEIKAAAYPVGTASLANVSRIIAARGDSFDASCSVRITQLNRIVSQITRMCQTGRSKNSPFDNGVQEEDAGIYLTAHDDLSAVAKAVEKMGYDLSEEDSAKVYEAFQSIAAKKEKVTARELDAIVASAAMQVPATYVLDTYVITAGNTISATAHLKLHKGDSPMEGVCIGDGPIDAAFLAIESVTGCHYELDDFQIQAVTEGREAMGQTVVKLRSGGKLYSGKGISTDIVGASIHAYISALNKIVYEEETV
jgi:2-isopropylmalate synthase